MNLTTVNKSNPHDKKNKERTSIFSTQQGINRNTAAVDNSQIYGVQSVVNSDRLVGMFDDHTI